MADLRVRPSSAGLANPGATTRAESDSRPGRVPSPEDYLLVDRLREEASQGRMDLDSTLSEVAHAARYFTDATGAALALWSQGVVICRARSGDVAPPLGAKLDVDSGISGECLRSGRSRRCNDTLTDPLVDGQVCQELGIRSLAAVPLRGEHGVVGILEVFSDHPNAFSDAHITLLKQLSQIAVLGRSRSAPSTQVPAPHPTVTPETEAPRWPEPAYPRTPSLSFLTAKMQGEEGRPIRLATAGLLLVAVLGGFGWMLSRGRGGSPRVSQSVQAASNRASPAPGAVTTETSLTIDSSMDSKKSKRPSSPRSDAAARDLVQQASDQQVTDRGTAVSPAVANQAAVPEPPRPPTVEDVPAPDSTRLVAGINNLPQMPANVVNAPVALPTVALRTSQGVTGGRVTHRVPPVYPSQARLQRIEGPVVLDAEVGEDGNVHAVKVLKGDLILAGAAKNAVQQWRYQPFELNGKPVTVHTEVTILFKLP
jgi:TonB family protein